MQCYCQALPFSYQLSHSRRKTIAIEIRDCEVRVKAPLRTDLHIVCRLLWKKRDWINDRLERVTVNAASFGVDVRDGGRLFWLGQALSIRVVSGSRSEIHRVEDELVVSVGSRVRREPEKVVADQLKKWCREEAQVYLENRMEHWQQVTGLRCQEWQLKDYRRRWGSCDNRRRIQLNWRIILADPAAIDYVLIHELCHLEHFNHSPAFWRLVAEFCPEFKAWKSYFRQRNCWLEW